MPSPLSLLPWVQATAELPDSEDDDDLGDLPPIDGERGEEPRALPTGEDDFDTAPEGALGPSALDDATGENDPVGADELGDLEGEEAGSGWLAEPADDAELDVGAPALLDSALGDERGHEAPYLANDDEPAQAPLDGDGDDDDLGLVEPLPPRGAGLDASAEEGPLDPDEDLREEDLPALDADDADDADHRESEREGAGEDSGLLDEGLRAEGLLGLPWFAAPWARVGAPIDASGAIAIACAARGALVASRAGGGLPQLARVDLEGSRQAVPALGLGAGTIRALAVDGERVAVLMESGRLFLSRSHEEGARFEPVAGSIAGAEIAFSPGTLWIRTKTGSLVRLRLARLAELAAIPELCPVPGTVVGLVSDGGAGVLALALDETGRPAALARGGVDDRVHCESIDAPSPAHSRGPAQAVLAARGPYVAYAVRGGVTLRGPGGPWVHASWQGRVTALAFVGDEGTVLGATYSTADDTTGLVRLSASGEASIVARIGARADDPDSDGRVLAMARDDRRGVVWLVGGFGVAAFGER